MKQKVFFTGFHKCATTSVLQFLSDQGYKSCDHGALSPNEEPGFCRDLLLHKYDKILETADKFEAFSDSPWFLLYELMDKEFDAKFIHSIRDPETWYKSCLNYFGGKGGSPIENYIYGRNFGDPAGNKHRWIERYLEHQYEVMKYFKNKDNFLLLDVFNEENPEEKLCNFLEIEDSGLKIGNHNKQIYFNQNKSNLKIGVVQLVDETYANQFRIPISAIGEYCKERGYDHHAVQGPIEPADCHVNYQKPLLLSRMIDDYDYVVWLDADVVPANYEKGFEEIIEKFDREIYYCKDYGGWFLNSGVIIFKNCETSKRVIEEWWESRFLGTDEHWRIDDGNGGCDQGRLIAIIRKLIDEGGENLEPLDQGVMNRHPKAYQKGDFLVHCMGYAHQDVSSLAKWTFNLNQANREDYFTGFGAIVPSSKERKSTEPFFDKVFSPQEITKKYNKTKIQLPEDWEDPEFTDGEWYKKNPWRNPLDEN
ncbi:MAG: hypothetical protein CL885_00170 [Dehalococcoidia bacterium]|nr:hypothetical protein [Dehalococcoidia bacterium]